MASTRSSGERRVYRCSVTASLRIVRRLLRQLGFDIHRWPDTSYATQRQQLIDANDISLVIDVGANSGQYAQHIRDTGYAGRIISFEPLKLPFAALEEAASADPLWDVRRLAIGPATRSLEMYVAANGGASSSVLAMLDRHRSSAPYANYIGTETVRQDTLDAQVMSLLDERIFLKLDLQGYELSALEGARATIAHTRVVEVELSFVDLYEGAPLYTDMVAHLQTCGFSLSTIVPTFRSPESILLQADAIFVRESASA